MGLQHRSFMVTNNPNSHLLNIQVKTLHLKPSWNQVLKVTEYKQIFITRLIMKNIKRICKVVWERLTDWLRKLRQDITGINVTSQDQEKGFSGGTGNFT